MPDRRARALFALATTGLLLIWAGAWWAASEQDRLGFERSAERAQQLAAFFERHTLNVFRYGDTYLRMVREAYLREGDVAAVEALMSAVPLDREMVSHVTLIDADGVPIFNSAYTIKPGITVTDRDYFIEQKAATEDSLYVSLPRRGRNSGKLLVRLVRPIDLPDGRFGGVIFAALDVESVTGFLSAVHVGPNSSATLVGNDRRIRARSSYGAAGPGQDISGSRLWSELEKSPTGLYQQTSVVDAVTRYYAYRQVEEFPLVVAIGMAVEDLEGEQPGMRRPAYALASLASVLILAATFLFWRESLAKRRLAESEAQIRGFHDELEQRVEERTAELQAVQEELLRKQRLAVLGQLTGTVAHELRNPLGTIVTTVAIMEHKLAGGPLDLQPAMARVRRSVDRCNAIIGELLDFTRVTKLDLQAIELDPWLEAQLQELSAGAPVPIRFTPGAGDAAVRVDTERLRRALINLLDNARDAVVDGRDGDGDGDDRGGDGEVRVLTRRGGDRLEIEVRDDGPGIPESLVASVHEPLFSTKTYGIGLGLPVVRQVMEDHGGGFELLSEPGKGTRAVLWLQEHNAASGDDDAG